MGEKDVRRLFCVRTYTMDHYSAMRKKKTLPFVKTYGSSEHYAKRRHTLYDVTSVWNRKKTKSNLIETDHRKVVARGWS